MTEEIILNDIEEVSNPIKTMPVVLFSQYEDVKAQCQMAADFIEGFSATDDESVKIAKNVVARARKMTDRIDRMRKQVKADLLGSMSELDEQVKELCGIVSASECALRGEIKEYEDRIRNQKEEILRDIYYKRLEYYTFYPYIGEDTFSLWLTPKHLLKGETVAKCEKDMIQWMETRERDVNLLKEMGFEYLAEYAGCLDFAESVRTVNERKKTQEKIETMTADDTKEEAASFIIRGQKDIMILEMFLENANIKYEKRRI